MSKRYFINNCDSQIGKNILKQLNKDAEESNHMGTFIDTTQTEKPFGIKKILKRQKPKLSKKKMLEECDVYIYDLLFGDLNNNLNDIRFVYDCFKGQELSDQKVLILISDIMCWSDNQKQLESVIEKKQPVEGDEENVDGEPKDEEEKPPEEQIQEPVEVQAEENENKEGDEEELQEEEKAESVIETELKDWTEDDYKLRKPKEQYKRLKFAEDKLLSLNIENLKVYVVCSGVLYGQGEVTFYEHFKAAWLQNPTHLPYLNDGTNQIPTIHIQDLTQLVIKLGEEASYEKPYIFGFDKTKDRSQQALIECISNNIGSGKVASVSNSELFQNTKSIFTLDFCATTSMLLLGDEENPSTFEWSYEYGLEENSQKVLYEFWEIHNHRPLKMVISQPLEERQENYDKFQWLLDNLSYQYRIPVIDINKFINNIYNDDVNDDMVILLKRDKDLYSDIFEFKTQILNYLEEKKEVIEISEPMKVFYRLLKWRLSQNDCKNRGYILDSFPNFVQETKIVFYPQKKNVLKKKKKKVVKKKKKQADDEDKEENENENYQQQEEQNEQQQEEQNEEQQQEKVEGEENEENEDNQDEEQEEKEEDEEKENVEEEQKEEEQQQEYQNEEEEQDEEEGEEEQEEEEEPEPEEEEQQEEDEDENVIKKEPFFPETFIYLKKFGSTQIAQIFEYFMTQNQEVLIYDFDKQKNFESVESLKIFIERNNTPNNYLTVQSNLKKQHQNFYQQENKTILKERKAAKEQEKQDKDIKLQQREVIAQNQYQYILDNESELIDRLLDGQLYIQEYIIPELNDGLVEVGNMLPEDPVEFLAEYLYKKSFENSKY